jgi:hypothetical protein
VNAHEPLVRQAIALAHEARRQGNDPFGALLVLDGQVVMSAEALAVHAGFWRSP